eukprot:XP_001692010.1 predicted protein [Chlamydomonas reinhardtii]
MTGPGADGTGARQGSSHLTASTDLDATPNQLPLAAVLDASLQRRKAAAVSSVALDGAMRDFTLVEVLQAAPSYAAGDMPKALKEAFLELDRRMQDPHSRPELAAYRQMAKADKRSSQQAAADRDKHGRDEPDVRNGDQQHGSAGEQEEQERELEVPAPRGEVLPPSKHAVKRYGMVDESGRYVGPGAGSTAAVAVVRGNQLAVAHAGDSRVVLCENGVAQALTQDHKPDIPAERDRIYQAGLFVMQQPGGVARVGGSLAMSRAMGDVKFKAPELPPDQQAVTAAPDTTQVRLGGQAAAPGDPAAANHPRLLVVACDGLWDVMDRQQVCNFLELQLSSHGGDLRAAVRGLVHEALRHDSAASAPATDNVTVLLVQLP